VRAGSVGRGGACGPPSPCPFRRAVEERAVGVRLGGLQDAGRVSIARASYRTLVRR